MTPAVYIQALPEPPLCRREMLRYAHCRAEAEDTLGLLESCIGELDGRLSYRVCRCELPVEISGDRCNFGSFAVKSAGLAKNLGGCKSALLFAATVGIEPDRLVQRYSRLSPARALMIQAIGAERIEALCDEFCRRYESEQGCGLGPRFSPGYGDLSLDCQEDIFRLLDCPRRLGLCLNQSRLMSPTKSVTAFAGILPAPVRQTQHKCALCNNTGCAYRSNI